MKIMVEYVSGLEAKGYAVHFPPRNVEQDDPTGFNIVMSHLDAMVLADEVHIFWDSTSYGSHCDLGMAIALGKKLVPVLAFTPDNPGKSYWKVIVGIAANQN